MVKPQKSRHAKNIRIMLQADACILQVSACLISVEVSWIRWVWSASVFKWEKKLYPDNCLVLTCRIRGQTGSACGGSHATCTLESLTFVRLVPGKITGNPFPETPQEYTQTFDATTLTQLIHSPKLRFAEISSHFFRISFSRCNLWLPAPDLYIFYPSSHVMKITPQSNFHRVFFLYLL